MEDEGRVGPGGADAALVVRARTGDQQAFADMFDRYGPRIHAFCTRVLGDPHTAADATQDTFVTAVRRLDQLRDPSALRPWLYAVARNECTRHGRARDRAMPVEDVAVIGGDRSAHDDGPARGASASEVGELLWAAADGLDERDRTLLELQLRHGLEGSELAQAAGISAGQISMATGRLRERLERSVGALLVARGGRADCPGLRVVLEEWDGRFSVLWRKRVARHVDRCEVCDDRRRALVAPLGSLAVVPMAVTFALDELPAGLRGRTLEAMRSAPVAGAPPGGRGDAGEVGAAWGDDGFPPLPDPDHPEDVDDLDGAPAAAAPEPATFEAGGSVGPRRRTVGVLALVLPLLLVVGAGLAWRSSEGSGAGGDVAAGVASSTTVPVGVDATPSPTSGDLAPPTTDPDATGAPVSTSLPLAEPEEATTTTGPPATIAVPAPTTVPPSSAPPATAPPDAPPAVGSLVRSGTAVLQTSCNPGNATRTISVTVTDDRGVAAVVLRWDHSVTGTGQRTMARAGSTWSATLGPFDDVGSVAFRAVATDTGGRTASTGTSSVAVDPCPG